EVIMPQLGESIVEGVIGKWLVEEGDRVEEDQPLAEIETDKVTLDIPAPASGTVEKLSAQEGETVEVERVIAIIAPEGEAPAKKAEPEEPQEPESEPVEAEAPPEPSRAALYSPAVMRLAQEHDLDLSQVKGTGKGGRVTKKDVLAHLEEPTEVPEAPAAARPEAAEAELEELVPLSQLRKTVAEHMARSKHTAPHVTTVAEVDMTRIAEWRQAHKEEFLRREGVKLTYMPFICQAVACALLEYPIMNSSWTDEGILIKKYLHLGIAVAVEEGLIVPVIRWADRKDIRQMAHALDEVATKARDRKLTLEDLEGATFSITNPGVFGAILSTPIIHQPQAAILSVEAVRKLPVVINDAITIRSMMNLCLSYDHRIVDGATAVQFLQQVRENLEQYELPDKW
ncbi:MAG: dihydrolipoamide acetyltransferase family protein, partial [Armatimonadota bacterium]